MPPPGRHFTLSLSFMFGALMSLSLSLELAADSPGRFVGRQLARALDKTLGDRGGELERRTTNLLLIHVRPSAGLKFAGKCQRASATVYIIILHPHWRAERARENFRLPALSLCLIGSFVSANGSEGLRASRPRGSRTSPKCNFGDEWACLRPKLLSHQKGRVRQIDEFTYS